MVTKQIRFRCVNEDDTNLGGILVKDGEKSFVICGCCGGVIRMDEIEKIQEYEDWVDISDEIIGE